MNRANEKDLELPGFRNAGIMQPVEGLWWLGAVDSHFEKCQLITQNVRQIINGQGKCEYNMLDYSF